MKKSERIAELELQVEEYHHTLQQAASEAAEMEEQYEHKLTDRDQRFASADTSWKRIYANLLQSAESMRRRIGELEAARTIAQVQNDAAKKLEVNIGELVIGGELPEGSNPARPLEGLSVRYDKLLWNREPVTSVEVTLSNAKSGYKICSWTSGVYMHERIMGWIYGRCKVVVATTKDRFEVPCNACGEVKKPETEPKLLNSLRVKDIVISDPEVKP